MRMYKVKTLTTIKVEIKRLFRKNKTYTCWFSTKTKFIYAHDKNEAEQKYNDLFFTPLESDEWTKYMLSLHRWSAEDKSNNMRFDLPFNYSIKSITESIFVFNEPITDNIKHVQVNSTYIDFRDWLMNGEDKPSNIQTLLEDL